MGVLYINNNGNLLPNSAPTIDPGNRAHLYGDGVFETIRIVSGKPINVVNHIARLVEGAKVLRIRFQVITMLNSFRTYRRTYFKIKN